MPAPVPAGYTRGPIQFFGALTNEKSDELLLQDFWSHSGGYGARIVIFPSSRSDEALAQRYSALFSEWQCDSSQVLPVFERAQATEAGYLERVAAATGILILGQNPLRFASSFGGTQLAQAIRRSNAQGKCVAGLGGTASVLCQHMVAFDTRREIPRPLLHRQLIQFAPGLGILNKLVLDGVASINDSAGDRISRLLTAVAYNPFLVGVSLEADTGITLYANDTFEVFGQNSALVIDGQGLQHTNLHEAEVTKAVSMLGVQLHVLTRGCKYSIDSRTATPAPLDDIPPVFDEGKSAF